MKQNVSEVSHSRRGSSGTNGEHAQHDDSFRQLLASQLSSLEEVLFAAHIKALLPSQKHVQSPMHSEGFARKKPAWSDEVLDFEDCVDMRPEITAEPLEKLTAIMPAEPSEKLTEIMHAAISFNTNESDTPFNSVPVSTQNSLFGRPHPSENKGANVQGPQNDQAGDPPMMTLRSTDKSEFRLCKLWVQRHSPVRSKKEVTRGGGAHTVHTVRAWTGQDEDLDSNPDPIEEKRPQRFSVDHMPILEADGRLKNFFMLPHSSARGCWDVGSMALVSYDLIFIPLGFFDLGESAFFAFMTWTTRLFWTLDVAMSFLTGYLNTDGTIEMRPKKIMKKYLYTWFLLDVTIVLFDWLDIGLTRMSRASRTFRFIRMIRLLRVAKIKQVLAMIVERLQSEALHTLVEMIQIVCINLIVAHLVACVWWGIADRDSKDTWVQFYRYKDSSFAEQYGVSLHWSISQFTGGMDEVVAQNVAERYFAIGVFLLCFIQASLFLSELTSAMTHLHIISNKQSRQTQQLRRFLHQNGISGKTALRIQRNAQHALAEQERFMPELDVELLKMVSEPMRLELHFEMYREVFNTHLFFGRYREECPAVIRQICHQAFSVSLASRGDVIFNAGEIPARPKTYVLFDGAMRYVTIYGDTLVLSTRQWIAEAALWTRWMHRGVLTGMADCRLYIIDARLFRDIVGQFEHLSFDPRHYARAYVADLNKLEVEDMTDLSFHLEQPGAEKHALKIDTEVYDLIKNVYLMKVSRFAGNTKAFAQWL